MNIIIDSNNVVLWVNQNPTILSGKECWYEFDESIHRCFFLKGFVVNQNDSIDFDGVQVVNDTLVFQSKKMYHKETAQDVTAFTYQDYLNLKNNFTTIEPVSNEPSQSFDGEKWIVDATRKENFEKAQSNAKIKTQLLDIDIKSIRAIREAILTGDMQYLQKHENDAKDLRSKLK